MQKKPKQILKNFLLELRDPLCTTKWSCGICRMFLY